MEHLAIELPFPHKPIMGKGFHPKFFLGDGNQQIPHEIKEKSLSF
jgi:hypothetical protein